ncbi:cell division protein FtsQ/DivIB [Peptoniphilus mikwangii]|uniref:cell division protein FtsQ/DivIB n=1 Tax=Peptoniphilus mikwangii TaxID=1354300 RepID=UPI000417CEE8|nr:FtsQ-type POTRA domain-containing protein [Peptoniphilus mikwangii]
MNNGNRKKKIIKRRKKRLLIRKIVSIIILFSIIIFFMLKLGVFNVRSINIKGASEAKESEIIKKSEFKVGENYFSVNKKDRIKNINNIPVIKTSKISFSLSRRVTISVYERKPILQIENYMDYYLLDDEFRIIGIKNEPLQNIVELTGIDEKDLKLGKFLYAKDDQTKNFIKKLFDEKEIFQNLKSVNISSNSIMCINKDNIEIKFGEPTNLDYKFKMLGQVLEDIRKTNKRATLIDMSKGDNIIVEIESDYSNGNDKNDKDNFDENLTESEN